MLKEFCNILLGHEIPVHNNHNNLTFKNLNTQRAPRWGLILEESSYELKYMKGENDIVADALTRLDIIDDTPTNNTPELADG